MATTAAILEIAVRADTMRAQAGLRQIDQKTQQTAASARRLTDAQTRQGGAFRTSAQQMGRYGTVASQTKTKTDQLSRGSTSLSGSLKTMAKGAAAAAAGFVGIGAAKQAVDTTTDLAKATITLNKNLGLSLKLAGGFAAEAKVRNIDTNKLTMTTKSYANAVVAASDATTTQAESFRQLGISTAELKKLNPDQLLFAIADGAQKLGDGAERTKALGSIFGRSFGPLRPLFSGGADALRQFIKANTDAGANLGAQGGGLKRIQELIDEQRQLKRESQGLSVAFTKDLAPSLIAVIHAFGDTIRAVKSAVNWFSNLNGVIGAVAHFKLADLVPAFIKAWKAGDQLGTGTRALTDTFRRLGKVFGNVKESAASAFGSIRSVVVDAGKAIVSVLAKIVRVVGAVIGAFNSLKSAPGDLLGGAKDKLGDLAGHIPGLQRGGTLVGGSGTGDKVAAMLEPGEVVLNRKAVAALGGSRRANSINAMVPRFAGGGVIGGAVGQAGKAGAGLAAAAGMALLKAVAKAVGSGGNVAALVKEASRMDALHQPYLWGGGHAGFSRNGPWDCSGAVSQLVHGAGLPLASPMVSGGFQNWGQPGRGKMSVLANPEHVYAVINGRAWGTSASNPGGGAGWIDDYTYRSGFTSRHAALANSMRGPNNKKGQPLKKGFQAGGVVGDFARAIVDTKAPHSSALALMMAGYAESGMRDLGYGDSTSQGALQLLSSTASSMGLDPHDEYGVAKAFLTRGYWGKGSGIGLANNSPATIAHLVQGNATGTGVYSAQRGRAVAALRSAGLKWDKHGVPRIGAAAAKTPKVKSPNKKKKPGGGGGGGSDWLDLLMQAGEDRFTAASDLADIQNTRIGSANELIGEGNFEALQRFQVGSSQNPILGLAKPGMPVPASLIPEMEPWQFLNQVSASTGSASPSISSVGVNNVTPQGDLAGHTLPKKRRRPVAQHTHVYIAGREVRHATKTELRRAARGGHRPLPSRGGGL